MDKNVFGVPENKTVFSFCKECQERCHSCVACGWVFTCKCEPCHESGERGHVCGSSFFFENDQSWHCSCEYDKLVEIFQGKHYLPMSSGKRNVGRFDLFLLLLGF